MSNRYTDRGGRKRDRSWRGGRGDSDGGRRNRRGFRGRGRRGRGGRPFGRESPSPYQDEDIKTDIIFRGSPKWNNNNNNDNSHGRWNEGPEPRDRGDHPPSPYSHDNEMNYDERLSRGNIDGNERDRYDRSPPPNSYDSRNNENNSMKRKGVLRERTPPRRERSSSRGERSPQSEIRNFQRDRTPSPNSRERFNGNYDRDHSRSPKFNSGSDSEDRDYGRKNERARANERMYRRVFNEKNERKYHKQKFVNYAPQRPTENFPDGRYVERVMPNSNKIKRVSLAYLEDRRTLKPKPKIRQSPKKYDGTFHDKNVRFDPANPFRQQVVPVEKRPLVMAAEKVRDYEQMIGMVQRKTERVSNQLLSLKEYDKHVSAELEIHEAKIKKIVDAMKDSLSLIPEGVFL